MAYEDAADKGSATQEFLDQHQYAVNSVRRYEKIFGDTFISTGGVSTTEEIVSHLNLKPQQWVLDVGCGIGGSAFYMVKNYAVNVKGIDLSKNMLALANENLGKQKLPMGCAVSFEFADATKIQYPENSFDVIYSRDAILHIYNKRVLFQNFFRWLKPGGTLCITDYCCGPKPHSESFVSYLRDRGYHLITPMEYAFMIESVGFVDVKAEDSTRKFIEVLQRELKDFENIHDKESFLNEFSQQDYDDIVNGWKNKLKRCKKGDQRWGLFIARKPQNTIVQSKL